MKAPASKLAPRTEEEHSNTIYGGVWAGIGALNTLVLILRLFNGDVPSTGDVVVTTVVAVTVLLNITLAASYIYKGRRKPITSSTGSEGTHV